MNAAVMLNRIFSRLPSAWPRRFGPHCSTRTLLSPSERQTPIGVFAAMTGAAAVELAERQTPHARGAGAGGALAGATSFAAGAAVVDATVAGGSEAVVAADKAAWVCGLLACAIVACAAGAGAFFDENGAASARPHRRSC